MRQVTFTPESFEQFNSWAGQDKKIYRKIIKLINDVLREPFREPFSGLGKPEPLKHELKGCWSRRITAEHRLVYRVTEASVIILSCRLHYD